MNHLYKSDLQRNPKPPLYQKSLRALQTSNFVIVNLYYRLVNRITQFLYGCEISHKAQIGRGLYIGHPYNITINPKTTIGCNCNIHKGVTIGQENRGKRKGVPMIGNEVWIGVNSTIVGKVNIGNDVLIAPNSYINQDIPSHSIVFGNPCVIKPSMNATKEYINNKI